MTNAGDSDEGKRATEGSTRAPQPKDEEFPVMPTADEAAAQRPGANAPKLVHYSFWLWIGTGVFAVFGAGLAFTAKEAMIEQAVNRNRNARVTPEQIADGANTLLWSLLIGSLILAALYALFGYKAREGTRSARTTLAVLTVITVLFQFFFGSIIGLFSALLAVVALVLLFMPSTRDYFPRPNRL
ncbi:MAG: hypothetical protein GEU98_07035 [Pseudonocardiaceae bacterium]|nr:hypothetical protein [Pseudonocardiaceae bacterium]